VGEEPIDVAAFVEARAEVILSRASEEVTRAHLAHYDATGREATAERLRVLLNLLVGCCRSRRLGAAEEYADSLAADRQGSGYPLAEVQTAINVLEEAVWGVVTAEVAPGNQGYVLGVVSTVLGAVKDRLACAYISQISSHQPPTLRLDYLFAGTEGLVGPS
jgi:hypothetical protein